MYCSSGGYAAGQMQSACMLVTPYMINLAHVSDSYITGSVYGLRYLRALLARSKAIDCAAMDTLPRPGHVSRERLLTSGAAVRSQTPATDLSAPASAVLTYDELLDAR